MPRIIDQKIKCEKWIETHYKDGVVIIIKEHVREYDVYEWKGGSGWESSGENNINETVADI